VGGVIRPFRSASNSRAMYYRMRMRMSFVHDPGIISSFLVDEACQPESSCAAYVILKKFGGQIQETV
jgi:hypothetical protein